MSEITTVKKTPAPIIITDEIQVSLNRLGRDLETHAESGIRIGKELIYLKEITPHGKFGELVEWAYGLKKDTRTNYMNVAEKFGEKSTRVDFSNRVLIELSRPSTPDSAREEALEHDALTVKQSKELVQAHKALEDLKTKLSEKITPNLDNLIPGLAEMLNEKHITNRIALIYSQFDKEEQQTALANERSKVFLINDAKRLERERAEFAESATKAHEKADSMQAQFDEAVGKSTEEILRSKDLEIKNAQAELSRAKTEIRDQLEQNIRAAVDREYQDEIVKAMKDKEKAEKEHRSIRDAYNGISEEKHKLEYKIKQLEERAKVNEPASIDAAHAEALHDLLDSFKNRLIRFEEDRKIQDYPMSKTWEVIEEAISVLSDFRDRTEGIVCINPIVGE